MHGRASKGSMGLDGGLPAKTRQGRNMHRLRSADLCIDRQDDSSDQGTTMTTTAKSQSVIALLLPWTVRWCKWLFTCNIKTNLLRNELRKQARKPNLGHIAWSAVCSQVLSGSKRLAAESYSSSAVVIFPSKITILFTVYMGIYRPTTRSDPYIMIR